MLKFLNYCPVIVPGDGITIARERRLPRNFFKLIFLILFLPTLLSASIYKKIIKSQTYHEYHYENSFRKLPLKSKFYVVQFLEDLSLSQQETIIWAYKTGKLYNYGYTLAAIAWKESLGGLVKINLFDKPYGSCGIFHNNLKTVIGFMKREHKTFIINKFNLNKLCSELQDQPEYSLYEAVKVLNDARQKFKNNWFDIWAYYNGGKNPNYKYAKDIYYRIKALNFIFKKVMDERRFDEDF